MVISESSAVDIFVPIQDQLKLVEERMRQQADQHHPNLKQALNHLLSSGGKRVRPAIVLLTGGMLGGEQDQLITLAASVELLHTATLVHDDLIDGSVLRRGISTLNAQWTPASTVLTGDFIFSRAANLAAELESLRLQRMFANTLSTIVNGEITQLFSGRGEVNREQYDFRIYSKTGSLFELAASAAALLSHCTDEIIEAARSYGKAIGMAFQIVDDLLDFTGQQATIGKPVGSDLRQGLFTLPVLYYLEAHPHDAVITQLRRGELPQEEEITQLVRQVQDSGAIELAMQEARRFMNQGLGHLAQMPDNASHRALEKLSRYLVDRRT